MRLSLPNKFNVNNIKKYFFQNIFFHAITKNNMDPLAEKAISVEIVPEPRLGQLNDTGKKYFISQGGASVQWYPFVAQSWSKSNFVFKCDPSSTRTIVDRTAIIKVPVKFTIVGTTTGTDPLLEPDRGALRALPFSSIVNNMTMNINGQSLSVQLSEICHAISRYNSSADSRSTFSSVFPNSYDMYQRYEDGFGSQNSALNSYKYAIPQVHTPRGAYPIAITANTTTSLIFETEIYEYVHISPFYSKKEQGIGGLGNVRNLTFNFNLANLPRMLSMSLAGSSGAKTITSCDVGFEAPTMFMGFITPQDTVSIPDTISYQYSDVNFYSNQFNTALPVTGAVVDVRSNVIQWAQIPERLYIYVKRRSGDVNASAQTQINITDTYAAITKVNVNFGNVDGIMSAMTPESLYLESERNGLNMSYTEFSGRTSVIAANGAQTFVGTTGSVICVEMGRNIPLKVFESVAQSGSWNVQMQVSCKNTAGAGSGVFNPELCIIAVFDGALTISYPSSASTTLGLVRPVDVESAPVSDMAHEQIVALYGGSAFGKMKTFVSNNSPMLKKLGTMGVNAAAARFPPVGAARDALCAACRGAGCHNCKGAGVLYGGLRAGGVSGGALVSKGSLKDRARH